MINLKFFFKINPFVKILEYNLTFMIQMLKSVLFQICLNFALIHKLMIIHVKIVEWKLRHFLFRKLRSIIKTKIVGSFNSEI